MRGRPAWKWWTSRAALALAVCAAAFGCSAPRHPTSPAPPPVRTDGPQPPAAPAAVAWRPAPGTTWQWQITGVVDAATPSAAMLDLDLQDAVPVDTSVPVAGGESVTWPRGDNAGVVARAHAAGKVVVCYLDSGAWEDYRPDAALFPREVIGRDTGWRGERWLDVRPAAWPRFAAIVWARLDLARRIGCDGVEPDQNNSVGNDTGFPVTASDQELWYLEVARQAHLRGLSVGMKNGVETVTPRTVAAFDWALVESCFQYDECGGFAPFVAAGKAVFAAEYEGDPARFCPAARRLGFSALQKRPELDAWRITCW